MKLKNLRLFSSVDRLQKRPMWLTLAIAGVMLFSISAVAQSNTGSACPVRIKFPPPTGSPTVLSTLCLSTTSDIGDTIALEFPVNNPFNGLALFDLSINQRLWCAHASDGTCAQGTQLVLRPDGNLELNDGSIQTWDTDTPGTNNGNEFLKITEDALACIVVVKGSTETRVWCSNNAPE